MNDGVLSEEAFLAQVWQTYEERKRMFFNVLDQGLDDLVVCVFDTPDRVEHMFWRDPDEGVEGTSCPSAVESVYVKMDQLVGESLRRVRKDTLVMVLSDHGFTSFRRGVNPNTWLLRNGYLHLLPDADSSTDWLECVDWSRTRAYALGLAGIFVNLRGREARGIVDPGRELDDLLSELKARLEALVDEGGTSTSDAARSPIRHVYVARRDFKGPCRLEGPDLIVGYERGYRCSREGARGQVTEDVFTDNTKAWCGDHCVDPELVPGVLFANRPLNGRTPNIIDIAPTVLDAFGLVRPDAMQGKSLLGKQTAESAN